MNTRIPFLLLALLVGVCCAAPCQDFPALPEPVLAVQRCFLQATVRLLPQMRYDGEIVFWQFTPFPPEYAFYPSTISPDGKRLFFIRELEDGGLQSYFVDLTTGEASLAKMPDQQPVELSWIRPLPVYTNGGVGSAGASISVCEDTRV